MLGDRKQFKLKSSKPIFILGMKPNHDPILNLMFACAGAGEASIVLFYFIYLFSARSFSLPGF